MRGLICTLFLALVASESALAVKHEDFKTCDQSSPCRRLRSISAKQSAAAVGSFVSPYSIGSASGVGDAGSWKWPIKSSLYPQIKFDLQVDILEQGDGIVRIRMDEVGSSTLFKRYNETAKWVLLDTSPATSKFAELSSSSSKSTITYGPSHELSLEIQHSPLKITQLRDGKPEVVFNERSLLHMEHFRTKDLEAAEELLGDGEQMVLKGGEQDRSWFEDSDKDMFSEKWRQWTDSKPKGPEALSIDITFPGAQHIFGLPEHATAFSLPDTTGQNAVYTDPIRLFNCDIFEYLQDSPMALYGVIPLLHAHSKDSSVGVLNLIGSETWVDILHENGGTKTHWMSESGILDILLLPGPSPDNLFKQYAILTGTTPLPPQWSTAYHQCRWNYVDEDDVLSVQRRFDEADIPLDVTWLDIEYAEEHRYFDWNHKFFPDPVRMQEEVASKGRKMVAIVDPHIKRSDSFRIYTDARDLDILVKNADGTNFQGNCWTGNSVWVDFFNPKSWDWWTKMFDFSVWKESTPFLFVWNDMNEPAIFDSPEVTAPRDAIRAGGWEERDVHNIGGMLFHNQTSQALIKRESPAKRPFVLSRSFFAGSHRYGAIWTGDNLGDWEHLGGQTAMLLNQNIAGMSFSGADVGGFFGNPSTELLVRWYQAGAFMPFFRAHAHIDTKRREPYLYDEPIRGYIRDIIRLRYQMLPVWYNAFHDASVSGAPILRPHYAQFPKDEAGFAIEDQFYVGNSGLLMKPVTTEGATETSVYLSDNQPYYDYFTHHFYPSSPKSRSITLQTPLDKFPLLLQGGNIIPIRQRVRRASPLMWQDPFTLIIALSKEGTAKGQLYLDDGDSFAHEKGEYIWRQFDYSKGVLRSSNKAAGQSETSQDVTPYIEENAWANKIAHVRIERIVVLGIGKEVRSVKVAGEELEGWKYTSGVGSGGSKEGGSGELVIKNPGVEVVGGWEVVIV